jgi:hypothetical protein
VINLDGAAHFHEAMWVEPGGPADVLVAALDQTEQWLEIPLILGAVGSDNQRYAAQGFPTIGVALGGWATIRPPTCQTMWTSTPWRSLVACCLRPLGSLPGEIGRGSHDTDHSRCRTIRSSNTPIQRDVEVSTHTPVRVSYALEYDRCVSARRNSLSACST